MFFRTIEQVRRFSRILAGFTLLLVGVIMLFTPGPGWLVVFFGLTLLAALLPLERSARGEAYRA